MNTRELIAALQAADPTGDVPVCVANADLYFVERLPAYYDGSLEQLVHDETKRGKAWSIVGARLVRAGEKVRLRQMPVEDLLYEHPELPVEGGNPAVVERWRQQGRKLAQTLATEAAPEVPLPFGTRSPELHPFLGAAIEHYQGQLIGHVMRASGGRLNPALVLIALRKLVDNLDVA